MTEKEKFVFEQEKLLKNMVQEYNLILGRISVLDAAKDLVHVTRRDTSGDNEAKAVSTSIN